MSPLSDVETSGPAAVVELPWGAWHGDDRHDLGLPKHWSTDVLKAHSATPCTEADIEQALSDPIGSAPLEELASGCRSVCIVVDDLARPTRAGDVLPPLLARIIRAGIEETSIDIVVATGSHGPVERVGVAQKVGEAIAVRYRVRCHDCRSPLADTGMAYGDRTLQINRTFFEADLKIVVGCVLPHSFAGYSGGAKLVIPGLANIEATARSHKFVQMGLRGGGDPNENRFRTEAEDIARQIGLRFAVCVVTDSSRRTTAICAGDPVQSHRAACEIARDAYATELRCDYDVAVLNAYPKDIDLVQADNAFVALKTAAKPIVQTDGLYVLTTAASEGLGRHGLFAPGGVSYRKPAKKRQLAGRELWIYAPALAVTDVRQLYWEGYPVFDDADDLKRALHQRFPADARCVVFPCAPMQQVRDLRTES